MSIARKHVVRFALLCCVIAAVAPAAANATSAGTAAVPCWKLLLNDWYDGTINKIYAIPCYSAAIKHLPPDLRIYGSAKDDILAARAAAEQKQSAPPEQGHPTTTAASTTTTTTTTTGSNGTTTTTVVVVPVTTPPTKSGGVSHLLNQLTPGNPDSFPLPLLILGALAIVLVIAGALGMLWQRSHPPDDGATEA